MLTRKLLILSCRHIEGIDPDVWWWIKSKFAANATLSALVNTMLLQFDDGMEIASEQRNTFSLADPATRYVPTIY
jgi:hypothetical protein